MVNYKLIEPSPLTSLQMNRSSSLYTIYLNNLKRYSRIEALNQTRDFIFAHTPDQLSEQIASMEFLYMNDLFDDLTCWMNQPGIRKDVSFLYSILMDRRQRKSTMDRVHQLKAIRFTNPSMHCLHLFTLVYSYYDLKMYTALDKYLDDCELALRAVDEPLMYYYLNQRYQELLFQHYWKTDNSILASRYAYKMINTELSPKRKYRMYHHLALCLLFDGYNSAIEPLSKALEIAERINERPLIDSVLHRSLPFISAFHYKTEGVTTPDPVENAHLCIVKGDVKRAKDFLRTLPVLTPFQESYMGLAERDEDRLNLAHKRFITERGDHFFARVPLEFLKRIQS
ncbi:AimR family lysis-lysogeny pheromone receptor [Halobacillus sp. BAB-2008]|uniref:AimR family lysis-lysogeny pheromone receptor n=1 Tax=Halobacillus sp. BAB-2008 TaxID=1246484 RepID=UPI0002A4DC81|nr:AimR family lysis-lysogeny pheromone receptor [Halobacillus sp. BAB-2008]ELK48708.1 hypothetical protein D479_01972 [Halobacillus sp. BAB-2008]